MEEKTETPLALNWWFDYDSTFSVSLYRYRVHIYTVSDLSSQVSFKLKLLRHQVWFKTNARINLVLDFSAKNWFLDQFLIPTG